MKTIALAGVPNCGKTTFWNLSTGSKGKTGNWPGVTSEKLSSTLRNFSDIELIDLPGIYSLSGSSLEEKVSEKFLKSGKADSIIVIIDGTKPEQGLFLALELLSLNLPMVIGINFSDEMKRKNISVNLPELKNALGVPIHLICAANGENINVLLFDACSFKRKNEHTFSQNEHRKISEFLVKEFFHFGNKTKNKFLNFQKIFCFLILIVPFFGISLLLSATIPVLFEHLCNSTTIILNHLNISQKIISLLSNGIIPGIEAVFNFIPQMFFLFLFLSILEDSGYMARTAFFSDYVLKKTGLSGRTLISMLIGLGCSVPAVYSIKSSENEQEKENALSALMFVPCGARLPLILLICSTVFPTGGKYTVFFLYAFVLAFGGIFSSLFVKKHCGDFILELPEIRLPSAASVLKTSLRRLYYFISKAFAVIVLASVLIWVLKNYDFSLNPVKSENESILFSTVSYVEPFFAHTGIPSGGIIALFCGLFSKEAALFSLVSVSDNPADIFTPVSAVSFLLFYLIYSPCIAALNSIRSEFGAKKAVWLFIRQIALAYFVSFSFYQIAMLIKNLFNL